MDYIYFLLVMACLAFAALTAARKTVRRGVPAGAAVSRNLLPVALLIGAMLAAGWVATELSGRVFGRELKRNFLVAVEMAAAGLNPDHVRPLAGSPADVGMPDYERLRVELTGFKKADPRARFCYLMAKRGRDVVFLVDSEPEGSKDYSAPGDPYPEAQRDKALMSVFDSGVPCVSDPTPDRWGVWISALAPVTDQGGVIAVLGIDIDARAWLREIALIRLIPIGVTFFVVVIIAGGYYFALRVRRSDAAMRERTERLLKFQSVLLGLAKTDPSDLGAAMRAVVRTTARTLGADRASVWFFSDDRTRFECACLYTAGADGYGAEQPLDVSKFPNYFRALDELRVIAAADIHADPATAELSDVYSRPRAISSLMDIPIRLCGKAIGVLSHEHCGGPREWSLEEQDFGIAASDFLSLCYAWDAQRKAYDELAQMQQQLIHSEKMATVGVLAAAVAHEINNPTAFVSSNLSTLDGYRQKLQAYVSQFEIECLAPDKAARLAELKKRFDIAYIVDDMTGLIRDCVEGAERIRRIVQDLRSFSRPDEGKAEPADINAILDRTLNIVKNEMKYKAEVENDYRATRPVVCNAPQISQVFMNILVNAAHAIEKYGKISIRTRDEEGAVAVEIADNGRGIAPEHMASIFKPFFTTKEAGKGTGLGLSISKGIVEKHGGTIEVASEPGKGTTFVIRLPVNRG
ncbi:MAG TPA: ATP-binding protein [bacterium]|nr:ATP-binding protein [bacterium]